MIVQSTDFVGEYYIPQDTYSNVDIFIEKYEKQYLVGLFGAELYKLFIADLTVVEPIAPQDQRFIDVFDSILLDYDCRVYFSHGIKVMLIRFIYYHYIVETQLVNTTTGTVMNQAELGKMKPYKGNLELAYNDSVNDYATIQWYMSCYKELDYPEYNGQVLEYMSLV